MLALTVSFGINVAFWGSLIYWFWINVSVRMQIGGCAVVIAFMAAVHWIGFRLWQRQFVQVRGEWRKPPSNRTVLLALTISFAINVALWGSLIYSVWKTVSVQMAVGRSTVFVAFMAGVHFIGYRLWQRQFAKIDETATSRFHTRFRLHIGPPPKWLCFNRALLSSWPY